MPHYLKSEDATERKQNISKIKTKHLLNFINICALISVQLYTDNVNFVARHN